MRYLVTAALPYANGPLHIGHVAGAYLPADIYVRHLRKKGERVLFVCGSDEHGAPITLKALKESKSPVEIVNFYHERLKKAFEMLNISFDVYFRTSHPLHHEISQKFFLKLYEKNLLYTKKVQQFYDEKYQVFLADRFIVGECPRCGFKEAYGDQCEKCGSSITPSELINPRSMISGEEPTIRETTHFFFPFSRYNEWISKFALEGYDDDKPHHNPAEWKNTVINTVRGWLTEGIHDRAITRDLEWGVKLPLKEYANKVMYVWFEAPIGYISATYYFFLNNTGEAREWWTSPETRLIHFIGKDNIVFHCILFPIMLKAHGEWILPYNVPANEFMNLEDQKISTSRNWAVWVEDFCMDYPDRIDELRFVLARIMPENKDSNFKWEEYRKRVNEELVGTIGNFISRFFNLAWRLCGGTIPDVRIDGGLELEVLKKSLELFFTSHRMIEQFSFKQGLEMVMEIARVGNAYLSDVEPWRTDSKEIHERAVYTSAIISWLLCEGMEPYMPGTAAKLRKMLNVPEIKFSDLNQIPRLIGGITIGKYSHLFTYFTPTQVEQQIRKLERMARRPPLPPSEEKSSEKEEKQEVSIEDVNRIQIVVGKIVEASRIPDSRKLLHLKVDIGGRVINVVAGIGESYSPEEVINKKIPVIINLKRKRIMGVESEGMVLVGIHDGRVSLMTPERDLPPGSKIQ